MRPDRKEPNLAGLLFELRDRAGDRVFGQIHVSIGPIEELAPATQKLGGGKRPTFLVFLFTLIAWAKGWVG